MTCPRMRLFAAACAAAALLAACSGGGATMTPAPPSEATSAAAPSAAAPSAAAPSMPATDAGGATGPGEACDPAALVARLPASFGGGPIDYLPGSGADGSLRLSDAGRALLAEVGRSVDGMCSATGSTSDFSTTIQAYRVPGLGESDLLRFYVRWVTADNQPLASGDPTAVVPEVITLAGRPVTRIAVAGATARKFATVQGDTLFVVQTDTDDVAAQVFGQVK